MGQPGEQSWRRPLHSLTRQVERAKLLDHAQLKQRILGQIAVHERQALQLGQPIGQHPYARCRHHAADDALFVCVRAAWAEVQV